MTPPINPATHQTIQPTHGWDSLHKFQIFKQNWNILISSSVIEFLLILGSPMGDEGWVDGSLGWWTCTCTCMHTHTCMCLWHHRESLGFPKSNGGRHLQLKLSCLTCICACVCMHACACICTCVGAPLNHPTPPSTHPPELQGAQNTKIQ